MGFEYYIIFPVDEHRAIELRDVFQKQKDFTRIIKIDDITFYEFVKDQEQSMPDYLMTIEPEGLYVLHNSSNEVFADLEFLQDYLWDHKIANLVSEA